MRSYNFTHQLLHLFHKDHHWNPDILEYYVFKVFRNIGFSLLALFVPVYLYVELHYSLFEIMIAWIINQMFFLIFVPFSGKVISKIGVKHAMLLHIPGSIGFAWGLSYLTPGFWENIWLVTLLFAVRAIPQSSLGTSEHLFLEDKLLANKSSQGSSLAHLKVALILTSLVSPVVGGLVSYYFGFDMLFYFAIGCFLIASIPMLLTPDIHYQLNNTARWELSFTWGKVSKYFHFSEFGKWFPEMILFSLWGIFIYIVVGNTKDMWFLVAFSSFVAVIASYFIGKYLDTKWQESNILKKSTVLASILFFLRAVFPTPLFLAITDAINNIVNPFVSIPYEKKYYSYLQSFESKIESSIAANMIVQSYAGIAFVVLATIFWILEYINYEVDGAVFIAIFFFFGLGYLAMNFISHIQSWEK